MHRARSLLPLLLLLILPRLCGAEVKLLCPSGYMPGAPFPVRIELLDATGARDWDSWDAQAVLSVNQAGVTLSTNRVTLRNGIGTALLTIDGSGSFDLTAAVNGQQAARRVSSLAGQPATVVTGTLGGTSSTWSGVVRVTGNVVVPAGHTLTIATDTLVLIDGVAAGTSGISIQVNGAVQSLGTETQPVTITCASVDRNWGQIRHDSAAPSRYQHTFISKAGRAPGEGHTGTGPAIRPRNSTLVFDSCVISDLTAAGETIGKTMMASGSTLTLQNCVLARSRMGPEIASTGLNCTNSCIMDMTGPDDADGIYLHDSEGRPLVLSGCVIAGGNDDAVDTLNSDVVIENSILRDWPNPSEDAKGVSVFHGDVQLKRCLIVNCFAGVSAKSSGPLAVVRMDHCTVSGAAQGVAASWKSNATAGNINLFLTNCIVTATDPLSSDFGPEKFVTVLYCLTPELWLGMGNIVGDPLFVNPGAGDYHLQPGSLAADNGAPAFPADPNGTPTDIGFYPSDAPPAALFCRMTSPITGAAIAVPANVALTGAATSVGGTVAKVEFFDANTKLGEDATFPYSTTWSPAGAGVHTLRAVATDSRGLSANSAPVTISVITGEEPSANRVVLAGSAWRFLDNGTDQGPSWVLPEFDDSTWSVGNAKLGYGDGDEATVLGYGPDRSDKFVTYYFRRAFTIDDPARVSALQLSLLRDDGAIVYINGQEVHRAGMPAGAVDYRTYAISASEYSWDQVELPAGALRTGTNLIAVEVHQGNASSSDLSFDLELAAVLAGSTNTPPSIVITQPADQTMVVAPGNIVIVADAADPDGTVANVSFYANGAKLGDDSSAPFSLAWNGIPVGKYNLVAVATDDGGATGTSPAVAFEVSTDTAPPRVLAQFPPPGVVTNLSQITVTFSKPVAGVNADDLLVNGTPAVGVTGSGDQFVFQLPSPAPGALAVTWSVRHGITDLFAPPHPFDANGPGATWQYLNIDTVVPTVRSADPPPGSTVPVLTSLSVLFSETVTGVTASDLLINAVPASTVSGSGAGPYVFQFPQPAQGTVTLNWAANHGIRDQANNDFRGAPWNLVLDATQVRIVINEIMYHPASEDPREEFIELHNREARPINLQGWMLDDAVRFTFPNVTLPAGGYLVIAADLATFQAKNPGVSSAVGNWAGSLSNSRETIVLADAQGNVVDFVPYADEGDWAVRQRGSPHFGHRGWVWTAEHDGLGKSLELIDPRAENDTGQTWAASLTPQGTPGAPNSARAGNLPPVIRNASHFPRIPTSTDPVLVTAEVRGGAEGAAAVTLSYRVDAATPLPFVVVPMRDDGEGGDATAGNGVYTALLPPQANHTVVEFFITAQDSAGRVRTWPAPALSAADGEGPSGQIVNALYQVDDTAYTGTQPLYKVIMREAERAELEDIHDDVNGAANSDAQMNATFISIDARGTELRYLAGVRNRGHGTRDSKPNNLRINFRSDETWKGATAINLNANYSWLQVLGAVLHLRSGSAGAYSQPVQVRVNNANLAFTGATERTYGSYAANEVVDADWADAHFPNDSEGNIYRALRDVAPAEFDYRTLAAYPRLFGPEDSRSYTNTWFKESNASEDDWTDLIGMLRVLGPNGTQPFTEANVRQVIDVEQWLRHLAIMNLLGNSETSPNRGYNDDYLLYRGLEDPRFILMYYDLDQILGFGGSLAADSTLFSATANQGAGRALERLLRAPEFEPVFYQIFQELINTTFSEEQFNPFVDQVLGGFVPEAARTQLKAWMNARRSYVQSQLPAGIPERLPLATIQGVPRSPTPKGSATLVIGGKGVTHYSYSVNGGAFGAAVPVASPLVLSNLPNGVNQVAVVGRNVSGLSQSALEPTVTSWVVDAGWPAVRLNELIASRSGSTPDQIELFNEGTSPVDLAGMRLTDDLARPGKFVFGAVILQPGGFLVLDSSQLGFALDASGEGLYLLDSLSRGGVLLDSCEFGPQIADYSLARAGDSGDWRLAIPTFGSPNAFQNLGNPEAVRINEWLASGSGPFPDDFIELYNPEPLPVAVGGFYLTDKPLGFPTRSRIPPNSFIPAKGYFTFTSGNGNQADEFNFGLAADQGEIALLAPDLSLVDAIVYASQPTGISSGRCPDGAWTQKALQAPTPGGPNQCPDVPLPPQTMVLIPFTNSWKYAFGTDLGTAWRAPGYNDSSWSAGRGLLGLEGSTLPQPLLTPLPADLPTYYFRAPFQVDAPLDFTSLQVTFLVDDGAAFYLNGEEVGTRYNLAPDAGYNTLASGTVGNASLQVFTLPASILRPGSNWFAVEVHQSDLGSSDIVFGLLLDGLIVTNTPSQVGLVINEVFADNRSFEELDGSVPDRLELYNPSASAVDLVGMSLTDDVALPRRWVFASGTVLPGKGFLKVRCDPNAAVSAANTGFGLKANGGVVYLLNRPQDGGGVQSSIAYGLQAPDWSIGRVPDGSANWVLTLPTMGTSNLAASLGDPRLLRINEWCADPASGEDWFELFNPNPEPVEISHFGLSDDLLNPQKHVLPPLSFIGTGLFAYLQFLADETLALGSDHVDFKLSASGETLALSLPNEVTIDAVTFGPQANGISQGRRPDGSAQFVDFGDSLSPGSGNYLPLPDIVVNEVLSGSVVPFVDAVELLNLSGEAVDIGGWFLSDSALNLTKYRVPANTILAPGGYKVLYETQFNSEAAQEPFALNSARGDQLFLSQAAAGALTGYRAAAAFGAAESGVSFGRFVTSEGKAHFVPLTSLSFGADSAPTTEQFILGTGAENGYPKAGPVVISELMYHPALTNDALEFIELCNLSSEPVPLYDPACPANTWRLRKGIEFDFPTGLIIPAQGTLVVASFDPQADTASRTVFLNAYGPSGLMAGPYNGRLDNAGEEVELLKPDAPQPGPGPDAGFVPYILVDRVAYGDSSPWPASADGSGHSLHRVDLALCGSEPLNWMAAPPKPGSIDADADALPDAYEMAHGLNPSISDSAADRDGDGLTNAEEYILGTDPTDPASLLAIGFSATPEGVWLQFSAQPARTYIVESVDRLLKQWQVAAEIQPLTSPREVALRLNTAGSAAFFRIRAGD